MNLVDVFKVSKLFDGMLASELHALEQAVQFKTYKAGRHIFQEGQHGDGLYIIVEGKVIITELIEQDERCLLAELGPGDFFGEMALVDDQPRSATATEQVLQAERLTLVGRLAYTFVRQFRNPLQIISAAAETAAFETATAQSRQLAGDQARKQVDRMKHLINEFLEFTRGTPSAMVLARASYADLVKPLIEEIRSELVGGPVSVELENEPPDVNVLVDPIRLGHVFQNLVQNACDAMPDGGRIRVRFDQAENEVVTEIEDTGRSISPAIAARLFDPLAAYGQGLELAICRRIIEDHHGKIRVTSESGGGTTFIFNLPLAQMSPSVHRA